jgi:hypothetical protein
MIFGGRTKAIVKWALAGAPETGSGGLPGDDASDVGRRHRRTGRWIGLSGQIAANLLPEPGVVDGGEGR